MNYINKQKKIELLAPAATFDRLKLVIAHGADAVYVGLPAYSLRTRINDFDIDHIREAQVYCREKNVKLYVTINIFAHNFHFERLETYIEQLRDISIDALIIADVGIINLVKRVWPEAVIHLSTQANCTNLEACRFWVDQGIQRVIFGRETELNAMTEIKKAMPGLELESFVHGALCMAYSGRCFISKLSSARSANLGVCNNACRREYNVYIEEEGRPENNMELVECEHGSYLLNSNDLCLIDRVGEMIDSGLDSLKIEGRTKSVYYLANVVSMYRRAIDIHCDESLSQSKKQKQIEFFKKEFEVKLVNRGYTRGFAFKEGQMAQKLDSSGNKSEWEFCGEVINSEQLIVNSEQKCGDKSLSENRQQQVVSSKYQVSNEVKKDCILVKVHNSLKVGDDLEIVRPGYDIIRMKLGKMHDVGTREEIGEAHGGQEKKVLIKVDGEVPEFSVIRRKIS